MSQLRTTKRKMKGNIADIKEIVEKAYSKGLEKGVADGFYKGAEVTINVFFDALETLHEVKDIGPKRYRDILHHFDNLHEIFGRNHDENRKH